MMNSLSELDAPLAERLRNSRIPISTAAPTLNLDPHG